jgi:hypothetical protein
LIAVNSKGRRLARRKPHALDGPRRRIVAELA